jgi:hypothetical protein
MSHRSGPGILFLQRRDSTPQRRRTVQARKVGPGPGMFTLFSSFYLFPFY